MWIIMGSCQSGKYAISLPLQPSFPTSPSPSVNFQCFSHCSLSTAASRCCPPPAQIPQVAGSQTPHVLPAADCYSSHLMAFRAAHSQYHSIQAVSLGPACQAMQYTNSQLHASTSQHPPQSSVNIAARYSLTALTL